MFVIPVANKKEECLKNIWGPRRALAKIRLTILTGIPVSHLLLRARVMHKLPSLIVCFIVSYGVHSFVNEQEENLETNSLHNKEGMSKTRVLRQGQSRQKGSEQAGNLEPRRGLARIMPSPGHRRDSGGASP